MTEQTHAFQPDWFSPPGDTIADLLEEKGWSQVEFARRCGYTTKHASLLINGKASITDNTAIKLERVLGSSARFWLTREARYREAIARQQELETLETRADWLKQLPLKHMIDNQWIRKFAHKGQQVAECLQFFGVSSIAVWQEHYAEPRAAFRASDKFTMNGAAVSAWLRKGELDASDIACLPYDKTRFKQTLQDLRDLTNETDPKVFVPALVDACAQAGVAVVFEPTPKGCPVSGATRWLTPDKALLMLSLRHKTNDHLWFAFFHEAGHILLHSKKMLFLEATGLNDGHEEEANRFAGDLLIPPHLAKQLPLLEKTDAATRTFAEKAGIPQAIVVGRMQNEGLVPWNQLNDCKIYYQWR